jgi:hypothetical protein
MLDRENDNCVVLFGEEDRVRKLRRERAMDAGEDFSERLRALHDTFNSLPSRFSKRFGHHH